MHFKAVKIGVFRKSREIMLFLLLFLCLLFSSFNIENKQQPSFDVTTEDSIQFKLYLSVDKDNMPENYISRIKAPVCEDGLCYDVELIVYWNLVGNFVRFESLPTKPLTKLKHEPFTETEYIKLSELLSSSTPTISKYKKHELTTKIQNVDGVSGATVSAVKDETIPGAVYTCFTLWHLVHGEVVDSIQKYTAKMVSENVVRKIIDYRTESADYFLIDYLSEQQFELYLADILPLTTRNNWSFAKHFFEKAPIALFASAKFQHFFERNYTTLEYYAQVSLLKKLQNITISNNFAMSLLDNLSGNTNRSELTVHLICFNASSLENDVFKLMINKITTQSIRLNAELSNQVLSILKMRKGLKDEAKVFEKYLKAKK